MYCWYYSNYIPLIIKKYDNNNFSIFVLNTLVNFTIKLIILTIALAFTERFHSGTAETARPNAAILSFGRLRKFKTKLNKKFHF